MQQALFGGGCFWGVEKFFQDIPGVIDAVSGYAGGDSIDPTYSDVCGGRTGHAEVVNVEYDTNKITFYDLTKKFLIKYGTSSTSNLDSVSQYRSIILYRNNEQKEAIEKTLSDENGIRKYTTQIKALNKFYEAEDYHQDYHGSCRVNA